MHVATTGQGPDLVLLHGWAMHGGIFAPLVERLRMSWTVHVVDLPGHGHSRDDDTPLRLDTVAAAVSAQVPPAVWVGWSLGGLVAQQAALNDRQRVLGLVAICSSPRFVHAPDWPDAVEAGVFRRFAEELAVDRGQTLQRFLALEVVGSEQSREQLRQLREQVFSRGEPAAHVLADGLDLLEGSDLRAELPTLRDAGLASVWLAGAGDRLVPWRSVKTAAALAGGRFQRLRGAGHAPFLLRADEVAAAIASVREP